VFVTDVLEQRFAATQDDRVDQELILVDIDANARVGGRRFAGHPSAAR
jgi:hypothetical protein